MKQRCNFITPSWLVALYSMYEETSHIIEPLIGEFGRSRDQSIELNFTRGFVSVRTCIKKNNKNTTCENLVGINSKTLLKKRSHFEYVKL